ncbi:MAG: DEAD/DEAH box helicase [Bacteroidales bacterium]|nr:DEAD/DEAH box helicase [Bacteroidales bacterium]
MSFTALGLSSELLKALEDQKFTQAYPVQEQAIPAILKGKDVLATAKTGSGKTASYVLPTLMQVQQVDSSKNRHIKVLVLVPTRELAVQVREVYQIFNIAIAARIKTLAVFGGVAINPQMQSMQNVDILVATPGRLLDLVESNAVHLSNINTLVLDEADKMLNLGFKDEMNRIFELLPKKRQNLLFSATLSKDLTNIEQGLLHKPAIIEIESEEKEEDVDLIEQTAYYVDEDKKGPLLRYLIKENNLRQVLIFASSVFKADSVTNKLNKNGIQAVSIHSQKSQNARTENLRKFKTGKIRVLVATDLIARGIDIKFLPCVINYELPRSPKDYIHRIGRTGRADNPGEAISFIAPDDVQHFKVIQKKINKPITMINAENIKLF